MRRALRGLYTILIVAGVLLTADAGITLAWQEPISAIYARITQNRLGHDLRTLERAQPTDLERRALARLGTEQRRIAFLARALRRKAQPGDALGRLRIGKIGSSFVVVQGTDGSSLQKGPPPHPPGARAPRAPGGSGAGGGPHAARRGPPRGRPRRKVGDSVAMRASKWGRDPITGSALAPIL